MSLSRRQFFRRFWKPGDAPTPERLARYDSLESYVRTQLLPYDFTLTNEQENELLSEVRTALQQASNEFLFSNSIRSEVEQIVDARLEAWRSEVNMEADNERMREVRRAAPDYVAAFLTSQASPATIDQLKETFGIDDMADLEKTLKIQIELWIEQSNDRLIRQYDVVSVRDLVFAQLRTWC